MEEAYLVMTNPQEKEGFKERANAVINRPIPKELIKEREGGGKTMLSYIEGETVIRLLNEAFGETGWSFLIVSKEIIESQPKQMTEWDSSARKVKKLFNADGTPKMEPQAPVVEVHGRLIVPSYGIREHFGSKTIIGGSSEQESAAKAAATDALKKCATLYGIGLELYSDKSTGPKETPKKSYEKPKQNYSTKTTPVTSVEESWDGKDIQKLKELKAIIGIDDNSELDPYVQEFTGSKSDTYEMITPSNIAAFNKFLEKKAETV